jgi:hypothetical protein
VSVANSRRRRRVLEGRHQVHGDEPHQAERGGRPPRGERAQPPVGQREHQGEHAADRDAEHDDAGAEPDRVVDRAADELGLRSVVVALGEEALEGDRLVDLRLADGRGDDEREEPGGALVEAHEVEQEQGHDAAEQGPGPPLGSGC